MSDGRNGNAVIITGSASGLSAATAVMLAKQGARIVINYASSRKKPEQTADSAAKKELRSLLSKATISRGMKTPSGSLQQQRLGTAGRTHQQWGTTKHVPQSDLDGLSARGFPAHLRSEYHVDHTVVRAARTLLRNRSESLGSPFGCGQHLIRFGIPRGRLIDGLCCQQGALNTMTRSLARALPL